MICVDPAREGTWKYGKCCHMYIDNGKLEQLHGFAQSIGLARDWFQPTPYPHYDLSEHLRKIAVKNGALEVDRRHIINLMKEKENHDK